ncbi:unnamed protein product [Spodoptera exigua]|nr:unnamed protein product [Spodoptera exigua]
MLPLLVILGVVFVTWYWWRPVPRSPPTVPGALPIIGHLWEFIKHRNDLWQYMDHIIDDVLENEELVQLKLGTHTLYIASDPEEVGIIANACLGRPYFYNFLIDGIGNGLVTADAAMWKIHRRLLNPAFSQVVLNTFLPEMNAQAQYLVSELTTMAGKGPVDVKETLNKFVLRTVCRTSLGLNAKDQDMVGDKYAKTIDEYLKIVCGRSYNVALHPSLIYNSTKLRSRELEVAKDIENILNPIIKKRKSDFKANNSTVSGDSSITGKFKPILDLLLHLSDEQHVFSDEDIRQHLDTFVIASFETTSSVLQSMFFVLGSNPDVQERIFEEVQEVFGNNEELTKQDMSKLIYLEAVLKESLRLLNIIPWIGRKLDTDVVLPKYTLRAGSTCMLSGFGLHRHSSWGPDAREFKPERWLNPGTVPTNPNAYAVFGIGKRNCIGKQYSMMSLKMSLAHIVRKFKITGDFNKLKWKYEVALKPATTALVDIKLRS